MLYGNTSRPYHCWLLKIHGLEPEPEVFATSRKTSTPSDYWQTAAAVQVFGTK
jgi:hypothetical protein